MLSEDGVILEEGTVQSTPDAFSKHFEILEPCLIAMEVGVHSRWASRVVRECRHQVVVANAVRLKLIYKAAGKAIKSMPVRWHAWHASIHSCSGRFNIAAKRPRTRWPCLGHATCWCVLAPS